jgi:hypothetical protein
MYERNRICVVVTALREWMLATFMNQIVTRCVLSDGSVCRASQGRRDKRQTAFREQRNVEVCHSRPIRWQFGILFSEMTFSDSPQSVNREMRVVDLTVAANERILARL